MPPFQYEPYSNRFAGSIADLLLQRGAIDAQAAERIGAARAGATLASGNAWAGAIRDSAQIPAQLIAQHRQEQNDAQIRQARGLDIQSKEASLAREQAGQAVGALITKHTTATDDGHLLYDIPGFMADAQQHPDVASFAHEPLDAMQKANDTYQAWKEQRFANKNALTKAIYGQVAEAGGTPDDFMLIAGPFVKGGTLTEGDLAPMYRRLSEIPDQVGRVKLLNAAAGVKPEYKTVGEGATLVQTQPGMAPQAVMTGAPKPPTETELAATINDPTKTPQERQRAVDTLKTLREQKNPPSLEEQLLTATAAGDTAKRDQILGTLKDAAAAKRDPVATAQLEAIRNLNQQQAQQRLDEMNPQSPKQQQKLEQEYRTVLQRGLSSRSGGLGAEDAKVQQANHLMSLMDQFFDPKTGEWNIPRVQLNELALGLAKLTAGSNPAGEGMMKEFQQRTAKGDIAGALTYLTGQPVEANTQAITKMLHESIMRQGQTAMENREGEMRYLRGLAPTDLAEDRRLKLEANSLNPLRQSRIIQNDKTGDRKMQVSLDGGKTWK